MITFEQAKTLATEGSGYVPYSMSGGYKRYMRFTPSGIGQINASIFGRVIATFYDDEVVIQSHGFEWRITTREAINHILGNDGRMWQENKMIKCVFRHKQILWQDSNSFPYMTATPAD